MVVSGRSGPKRKYRRYFTKFPWKRMSVPRILEKCPACFLRGHHSHRSQSFLTAAVVGRSALVWRDAELIAALREFHRGFQLRIVHRRENQSDIKRETPPDYPAMLGRQSVPL